jgi:hypothetical protein
MNEAQTIHGRSGFMSISAVGGVNPAQSHVVLANIGRPESGEAQGAPDHDGDSDDTGTQAPAATVSSAAVAGHVNVKA